MVRFKSARWSSVVFEDANQDRCAWENGGKGEKNVDGNLSIHFRLEALVQVQRIILGYVE